MGDRASLEQFWFAIFKLLLLVVVPFLGGDQVTDILRRPRCRIMYSSGDGAGDPNPDKLLSFSKESSISEIESGDETTGSSWSAERLRFGVVMVAEVKNTRNNKLIAERNAHIKTMFLARNAVTHARLVAPSKDNTVK